MKGFCKIPRYKKCCTGNERQHGYRSAQPKTVSFTRQTHFNTSKRTKLKITLNKWMSFHLWIQFFKTGLSGTASWSIRSSPNLNKLNHIPWGCQALPVLIPPTLVPACVSSISDFKKESYCLVQNIYVFINKNTHLPSLSQQLSQDNFCRPDTKDIWNYNISNSCLPICILHCCTLNSGSHLHRELQFHTTGFSSLSIF